MSDQVSEGKERGIILALDQYEVDVWKLRELALSKGGLLTSDIRHKAWPKLLGLSARDIDEEVNQRVILKRMHLLKGDEFQYISKDQLDVIEKDLFRCHFIRKEHRKGDRKGIEKINDSFVSPSEYLYQQIPVHPIPSMAMSPRRSYFVDEGNESPRVSLDDEDSIILTSIIIDVLQHFEGNLHYYQGFHNIAAVVFLNLSSIPATISALQVIARSYFSEAMQSDFNTLKATTEIFFPLIRILDRQMLNFFIDASIEPSFILSWMITWFSHEITNFSVVSRLFDCFIASHPLFPLYFFSSVILFPRNRRRLLETDSDFASIHMTISDIFKSFNKHESSLDLENVIRIAISFMEQVPPQRLEKIAVNMSIPPGRLFLPCCSITRIHSDWVVRQRLHQERSTFQLMLLETEEKQIGICDETSIVLMREYPQAYRSSGLMRSKCVRKSNIFKRIVKSCIRFVRFTVLKIRRCCVPRIQKEQ